MLSSEAVNNYETPINKKTNSQETSLSKNQNNFQIFCKDLTKINELDGFGWTPLYRSVVAGDISSATFLIKNGADPNIKCTMGETPLYQAVEMENIDMIKLLLKKGADPNITNDDDLSPLHAAVSKQNILIVKTLLKYGANPNIKSKLYQQTPLHIAIKNNADPMILLLLVQFNGSLIKEDKFNKKPVDYTNSKEMQSTIEKLKFGKEELKIGKEKNEKKFETPSKKPGFTPSYIYSNTIRSKSKGKEFVFGESNAILQNPGNIKLTIIDGKNNIFSNDKLDLIENDKKSENVKKDLFNLKDNSDNIVKSKNEESINNINENLNIDLLLNEKNKSYEESIELDNSNMSNLNFKEIDYSLLRKKTGKFVENLEDNNLIESQNSNNSIRPKSMKIDIKDIEGSDINQLNNNDNININKPVHFSFSSNTFKNFMNKKTLSKSIKENESNKENINNNIKDNNNNKNSNTKKASSKTFKKQTNNVNKNKKKVIIKKYFNQEEKGDNKSKINFDKFNPKNCLYEKIIKKSVTKIEIYDDSKESMSQIIKRDSTMDDSKIKSTNNSLYNKPILKPIKINNLKKIIKNDENRPSFSVKLNKSIISADGSQSRKKNIFMKKEKYKNSNSSLNGKNNEMNINTINTERNKNNKRLSVSRGSMTTLSASRNEYLKNINNKNNQSNLQSNLWKFANDIPYNDKIMYQSSLSNNLISEISNEYNSNNKFPIFDWLKDIGLHCYYNLFIEKKIFSMQKVITNLKSGKYIITKTDIEKIGIIIHGHIYRILTKLEIDSEKINQKIINLFINSRKNKGKEINIMNNSVYFCCGCCATNERKILNKIKKDFNLDQWLNKIKMIKYKDNFIENGFDLFEYFILQMFTSIPVDDHILKDELDIQNDKDRDIILLRLNKDVKYMMLKVGENNFEDISKEENKLYEFDNQASETKSECIII